MMKQSKIKLLEIQVKKRLSGDFLGAYNTAFKGAGLIFRDLREYIIGDSIKKIDWKASSRLNQLHVKNFEEERDLKVFFMLDISKSMDFGVEDKTKKDLLLELFFILSHSVIKTRDKFGAFIYNEIAHSFVDYKSSEENIIKILKEIDLLEQKQKNNKQNISKNVTINAFKTIEKQKINNSLIFVLTDKQEYEKAIFKLIGASNEVVYINLFDYFENNLLSDNLSINLGIKNFFNIFMGNKRKIKEYKYLRKQNIANFKKSLRKIGIDYLDIDTKTDIFRLLLKYFNSKTSV